MKSPLVFIIEDLDRNETSRFETQEVLAFLERLKCHKNIQFILSGGLTSSREIDYVKFCDHIEILPTIHPSQSSALIQRVIKRCLDQSVFPHIRINTPEKDFVYDHFSRLQEWNGEDIPLLHSIAILLNTPRSLRHSLSRTYNDWKALCGEIHFSDLLAVNILRYSAPECLLFLMRWRDRLGDEMPKTLPQFIINSPPQEPEADSRQAIINDWIRISQNADWNPLATIKIIKFLFPNTSPWPKSPNETLRQSEAVQSISNWKYWLRAVTGAIAPLEIKDQQVLNDFTEWVNNKSHNSALIENLVKPAPESIKYSLVLEHFFTQLKNNENHYAAQIAEKIVYRILSRDSNLSETTSMGFSFSKRYLLVHTENRYVRIKSAKAIITSCAQTSLNTMISCCQSYILPPRQNPKYSDDVSETISHAYQAVKSSINNGLPLNSRLHPKTHSTLLNLIGTCSPHSSNTILKLKQWRFMSHAIIKELRAGCISVAANCTHLLTNHSPVKKSSRVNTEMLDHFFRSSSDEVINLLESLTDDLPNDIRDSTREVIKDARKHLSARTKGSSS